MITISGSGSTSAFDSGFFDGSASRSRSDPCSCVGLDAAFDRSWCAVSVSVSDANANFSVLGVAWNENETCADSSISVFSDFFFSSNISLAVSKFSDNLSLSSSSVFSQSRISSVSLSLSNSVPPETLPVNPSTSIPVSSPSISRNESALLDLSRIERSICSAVSAKVTFNSGESFDVGFTPSSIPKENKSSMSSSSQSFSSTSCADIIS
mmetsp:Transcript_8273/g.9159  ORF Transcript_8273/g.9159 Transcript_8273/m.9159 type:complete len:210 (+) Transcript_8273:1167-1796(+)